ncbi:uncharacterized protein LOC126323719 [Schistocerca gregaria]|uniref:uncharacterized protein LOC126323719 n=1 Tax=Schistocerca gregaria TaxID=7010 RepID=UPI00211E3155|nr:uncharacterized protein LOC126323719 [Schistocerca gregaria]
MNNNRIKIFKRRAKIAQAAPLPREPAQASDGSHSDAEAPRQRRSPQEVVLRVLKPVYLGAPGADAESAAPTQRDLKVLIYRCLKANKRLEKWFCRERQALNVGECYSTLELVECELLRLCEWHARGCEEEVRALCGEVESFLGLQRDFEQYLEIDRRRYEEHRERSYGKAPYYECKLRVGLEKLSTAGNGGGDRYLKVRMDALSRMTLIEVQMLWERSFPAAEMSVVSWQVFARFFEVQTKRPLAEAQEQMLRHVLDWYDTGYVTPRGFDNLLRMFGPVDAVTANLESVYRQAGFCDYAMYEEVVDRLQRQLPGTYMLRFSPTRGDSFELNYVDDAGKIHAVEIRGEMPLGVVVKATIDKQSQRFSSIFCLVEGYGAEVRQPLRVDESQEPCYFAQMTPARSENILRNHSVGTYLTSSFTVDRRQCYVVSYTAPAGVKHEYLEQVSRDEYVLLYGDPATAAQPPDPRHAKRPIYASLSLFLKLWHHKFRCIYVVDGVPRIALSDYIDAQPYVDIKGPGDSDGHGAFVDYQDSISARTVSTYPRSCLGWSVICDQWHVRLLQNRVIFALADGCNWGNIPRLAALRATQAVIDYLTDPQLQSQLRHTTDVLVHLLSAFQAAHDSIIGNRLSTSLTGTTTLIAGMLLPMEHHPNEWALVMTSVGDCKALVYNCRDQRCVDVTFGNRRNIRDARDPGGRLGPCQRDGLPDLRNLYNYYWPLNSDDRLIVISDGVHDNLDPQLLGKLPLDIADSLRPHLRDLASRAPTWSSLNPHSVETIKSEYAMHLTSQLIQSLRQPTPSAISSLLVNHALSVTQPSRRFMEENAEKPEPTDYRAYPGKMDHTSCICLAPHTRLYEPNTPPQKKFLRYACSCVRGSPELLTDSTTQRRHSPLDWAPLLEPRPLSRIKSLSVESSPAGHQPGPIESHASYALSKLPRAALRPYTPAYVSLIFGPSFDNSHSTQCGTLASGWATSTYPQDRRILSDLSSHRLLPNRPGHPLPDLRSGDPNTTRFSLLTLPNRTIFAVSCGARWGMTSATAAYIANTTFVDSLLSAQHNIDSSSSAALACIRSFDMSHAAICDTNYGQGTTGCASLLAGMLAKCTRDGHWLCTFASVGNLVALLYNYSTRELLNLHDNYLHYRRTGYLGGTFLGRSSPFLPLSPNLDNFSIDSRYLNEQDIIIVMTPGTYDNFDPEFLGHSPRDVNPLLDSDSWSSLEPALACKERSTFRLTTIKNCLSSLPHPHPDPCHAITHTIIDHCAKTTEKVRLFMQDNFSASTPRNHKEYPGKMGHALCLSIRAGTLTKSEIDLHASRVSGNRFLHNSNLLPSQDDLRRSK